MCEFSSEVVMARNFFGIVQKLFCFIEGSTKRHGLFQDLVDRESDDMQSGCRTMKSLCTTRWSSRADNCAVILNTLPIIVSTLEHITTDSSYNCETASDAFSMLKTIDFNFCLCLTVMHNILLLSSYHPT